MNLFATEASQLLSFKSVQYAVLVLSLALPLAAHASPATDTLLNTYALAGAKDYNANRGETLWKQQVAHKGATMACTHCHGDDLRQSGEHYKTHKPIQPMAHSVNAKRYDDVKKIEKWFKRNCKDTWGRECTAQEKGDILVYLLSQ